MKRIAVQDAPACAAEAPSHPRWEASLSLAFARQAGATRLTERSHAGPLRVQKPLYPEGNEICHAIIIHPPGGVVGGDRLSLAASVGDGAQALIATPGAAKWYRANGRLSEQEVRLRVGDGACLEWLPQETIFFDAARVRLTHAVELGEDARYLGCEILCFGRTASGERFASGAIEQTTSIRRAGRLVWHEQGAIEGGDAMHSPLALGGATVCATLIGVGHPLPAGVLAALREELAAVDETEMAGATQMKGVTVVRYLGRSSERARRLMLSAWRHLRPALAGREAVVPRIWNT